MPIRSVLAVDVDDDAFKAFHATFLKYQTAVARLPGQWKQVTASAQGSKNIFVDMAAALMAQAELLRKTDQQMQRNRRTIDETQRSMHGLARSTKEFAGNLMSATSTLLKWTGVGGIVGSLAGILSLQGISRLAGSSTDQYRTSMSLAGPTTPGQVAAASAFKGIGDPRGMLAQLSNMMQDPEGLKGLLSAGIDPSELGKGAGALLPKFLRGLQRVGKTTPESQFGAVLPALGLGGFQQQITSLKKMNPNELEEFIQIWKDNLSQLSKLDQQKLKIWTQFDAIIDISGKKIENAFIDGLGPVVPAFKRIATAFSDAVADFLTSGKVKEWMEALAGAIEKVDINDFAQKIKDGALEALEFAKNLGVVAQGLADLVRWIAKTVGNEDLAAKVGLAGGAYAGARIGGVAGAVFGPGGAAVGAVGGAVIGGVAGAYVGARADNNARRKQLWSPDNPNAPVVASAPIPGATNNFNAAGPTAVTGGSAAGVRYNQRMQEMVAAARAAGFTGDAALRIAAIAMAESSGNSMSHNTRGLDDSYGITQINARAHGPIAREALGNDKRAMELAFKISKGGTDFSPWTSYKDKKYEQFMGGGAGGEGGPAAFITHHTGGRGTVEGVTNTLKQRGLGVQYVMDRDGNVFQTGGPGSRHIKEGWGAGAGLSNRNTVGMEIIAKDDKDVTPEQATAFAKFMQQNYPKTPIFGHGEVNPGHKQADEGMTAKRAAMAAREQNLYVTKGYGTRVTVTDDTGGNAVTSGAQVAQ